MPTNPTSALDHYRFRFLQQLLTEATADYWERRATAFDKDSDTAAACRAKAYVLRNYGPGDDVLEMVGDVLAEQDAPRRTGRSVA